MDRQSLAKVLYPQIFTDVESFKTLVQQYQKNVSEKQSEINSLNDNIKKLLSDKVSDIDVKLNSLFTKTKNIAYENKRAVASYFDKDRKKKADKVRYSVFLNQMITPDAFEVLKFKAQFSAIDDDMTFFKRAGDALAQATKWVSEQDLYDSGDYYLYPEESLTGMSQYTDCEDVSFVMASLKPNVCAVAYGFYRPEGMTGKRQFGHAFPVFVYNDLLYVVETTGDSADIREVDNNVYEPIYYVTKNHMYKVRGGVDFGKIANY